MLVLTTGDWVNMRDDTRRRLLMVMIAMVSILAFGSVTLLQLL